MFEDSNIIENIDRKRQSINRCESQDICSPPWIQDLICSKKEKLVDIVNSANSSDESQTLFEIKSETFANSYVKESLTSSELNISYISSKSGSTSIGSTSTSPQHSPSVSLPNAVAQALNECQSCHSCQHLQRDVPSQCDRESGFHIKTEAKAVHLHSAGSRVNVPIVRSVSSSVITGRPFSGCGSRCIVSTTCCVDSCLERLQSLSKSASICEFVSNDSTNDSTNDYKYHQNSNTVHHKSSTSRVNDSNSEQQITPGLVAQRKIEILQRQVSESSFFAHSCLICGKTNQYLNNEILLNNILKQKMISEKNKDKSEYNDRNATEKNGHQYEEIMDYKRSPLVNTCEKHCKLTNGVESKDRDDEYELKYGPGIVNKLKHKFMSISVQSSQQSSNYKLKRCSSLENILVDFRHNQTQHSLPSHLSRNSPSEQTNDLLMPLLGKKGTNGTINVRSITDAGNRSNGSQLSHRLYIQHHNNKNLYNSKSSAIVPLIKRAKSMETLLLQSDDKQRDTDREGINSGFNQSLSKRETLETPLSNRKNDLRVNPMNDSILISDKTHSHKSDISANTALSQTNTKMKSVSHLSGITDELPKPDTVKTYKRIFEPTGAKTSPESSKSIVSNNVNNKSNPKNNYKKSQPNGSSSTANVKRKPPVLRATNKSVALKTQTPVNSSSAIKSQSPLPQVIESIPSPTVRSTVPSLVGQNDKNNNNSSDINKSANQSNTTSNTTVRKPPIAPKRASLTLKPNPLTGMTGMSALSAINKNNKINGSFNNTNALKKVQKIANNSSISSDNKITEKGSKPKVNDSLNSKKSLTVSTKKESSDICSNTQINGKSESLSSCESSPTNTKSKVIKPIANIKPFTQNNQINGDLKSNLILNDCQSVDREQNDSDLGQNKTNETSIVDKSEPQLDSGLESNNKIINNNNNKSNKNDNNSNGNVLELPLISNLNCNTNANKESKQEENSVAVNDVNDENVSPNTCDISVVKSRVNDPNSPSNEPPVEDISMQSQQTVDVLKPSLLLNSETNHPSKTTTSSLWSPQNKKKTNSSTTTIVFDFRGKDVKSNLAIHPLPFGVSAPKRLNGSSNGTVNDSDDDENYSGSTDIPLPSGIIFLGENVVIGKGSLLLNRNKKLSIQFNDSATQTYEYPSEASLFKELNSELTNSSVISDSSSRTTAIKGLGVSQGGRLGSYKPTVIDTPFELGVSRVENSNTETVINSDTYRDESDVVKPANPDETSSWSTSSTASDLLF